MQAAQGGREHVSYSSVPSGPFDLSSTEKFRNSDVKYTYGDQYFGQSLDVKHMVYVMPSANVSLPEVTVTPVESGLEGLPPARELNQWYPIITPESMKILTWNARGAGREEFIVALDRLITSFGLSSLLLWTLA